MNSGRVLALNSGEEWALQIEMGEMAICLLSLNYELHHNHNWKTISYLPLIPLLRTYRRIDTIYISIMYTIYLHMQVIAYYTHIYIYICSHFWLHPNPAWSRSMTKVLCPRLLLEPDEFMRVKRWFDKMKKRPFFKHLVLEAYRDWTAVVHINRKIVKADKQKK